MSEKTVVVGSDLIIEFVIVVNRINGMGNFCGKFFVMSTGAKG